MLVYGVPFDQKMVTDLIATWFYIAAAGTVFYVGMTWIGQKLVDSEMPRQSNEKLLNGLKEGVFIADENSGELLFQNVAAFKLSRFLESGDSADAEKSKFSSMLAREMYLERESALFAPITLETTKKGLGAGGSDQ